MFGYKFVESQPTTYLMAFRSGKVVRQGAGLSLFYFAPTTTLVAVPVASRNDPFIFEKTTADFQAVTVQGHVSYRIADPEKTASLLNFSLKRDGASYESKDPEKLSERIVAAVQILVQQTIQAVPLTEAIRGQAKLADGVLIGLRRNAEIAALGVEVLGIAVLAVKPTPETSRALEARAREAILRDADDAVFTRRNAAVENERAIKQSELDTEIAVEQKKRTIRETQMEAEAAVRRKKNELRQADMDADVQLEERRKSFVQINAQNIRTTAEAEAHRVATVVDALKSADPRVVQALTAAGMQPGQLIAQAFTGIAEKAERIGQLNLSPDLLQTLLAEQRTTEVARAKS
jgi:SPFH domain/Band 7 family protein